MTTGTSLLRGGPIYLRALEREDLARCHDWINRPEIFVTMGVFGPRTAETQAEWYARNVSHPTNLVFALCLTDDDTHIGNVSLFDIDHRNGNAGLTIFIAEEEYRGKGYGAIAVWIACTYAFQYLNLHKVHCRTDSPVASRLYESLGFRHEGTLREHAFHYGKYIDKSLYGVLRDDLVAPASLVDGGSNR